MSSHTTRDALLEHPAAFSTRLHAVKRRRRTTCKLSSPHSHDPSLALVCNALESQAQTRSGTRGRKRERERERERKRERKRKMKKKKENERTGLPFMAVGGDEGVFRRFFRIFELLRVNNNNNNNLPMASPLVAGGGA